MYEAHVKGLTHQRSDIPEAARGTYRGLSEPGIIAHLRKLGVTAIELLPIHAFLDDRHLLDKGLRNYWGYNTLELLRAGSALRARQRDQCASAPRSRGCTTPASRSSSTSSTTTPAKATSSARRFCYRGIDNASYYWLMPDEPRYYDDFTGTGNSLKLAHPRVLQMVMDSLRHWVEAYHVDGFRFDLASTLGARAGVRPQRAVPCRDPAGPGARQRQADRRAVGHRHGRLSGRRLSRMAGRNGTTSIAAPCGASGAAKAI